MSPEVSRKSRSAIAALVLGIVGLLTYPLGIASILAIIFAIIALREIRTGKTRGRWMSISGILLGIVGFIAALLVWTFLISSLSLPKPMFSSPEISKGGIRYLKNYAAILSDFSQRSNEKRLGKGRFATYSSVSEGRKDSIKIYYPKGLETATSFKIGIKATKYQQGDTAVSEIQGNLLFASKYSTSKFLPVSSQIRFDKNILVQQSAQKLHIPIAYAADPSRKDYGTGEPSGGQIAVEENRLTLFDKKGNRQGEYTFDGLDVPTIIQETYAKQVPLPNEKMVKEACKNAKSVANAHVFTTLWDSRMESNKKGQKISKNETAELIISKAASYDCKTKQRTLHFFINFQGAFDGKKFQGIVFYPIPPVYFDMEKIKLHMKETYQASTGRKLTTLQCGDKERVSYKESPIKCNAKDAKDNSTTAEITINDASYSYAWGPVVPSGIDMAEIEKSIKEDYIAKTGRKLIYLKCSHKGIVSYKDSAITCDAKDSNDGIVDFTITIRKDNSYYWAWKRSQPQKPTPIVQPSPRKSDIIVIECPSNSDVIGINRAGLPNGASMCSESGTYRHFCPPHTEPVYGSDNDIAYCYNPYNEAGASKGDPNSAWLGPGYGPSIFSR